MRIINKTEIDTDILTAITKLITKGYIQQIAKVVFNNTRRHLYRGWCGFPTPGNGAILRVSFPTEKALPYTRFPYTMNSTRAEYFPRIQVNDIIELIIEVLAHEFDHLRLHVKKNKNTEVRAERYAQKILERFRTKYFNEGS